MNLAFPWALLGLAIVPYLIWRILAGGRSHAGAVTFSDTAALGRQHAFRAWLSAVNPWLKIGAYGLMIVALARPQTMSSIEKHTAHGIDIMLTMDTSGSMLAEDFKPKNRFKVAKETLEQFALQTHNDRLGLVIFARQAFTQCPLTLDHEMVAELIRQVQYGIVEDGTAIGMAIATAAHRLRESQAKSKLIILMTDGMNNAGKIDPITAARAADALGVRVYTIGVGKRGGAPIPIGDSGILGKRYARKPDGSLRMSKIDEETLKKVANLTGAKYFRATDAQALKKIYADIRQMEKSKFEMESLRPVVEDYHKYLWPAVVLLLGVLAIAEVFARKAP